MKMSLWSSVDDTGQFQLTIPNKHEMLYQCYFNVGPPSATLGHWVDYKISPFVITDIESDRCILHYALQVSGSHMKRMARFESGTHNETWQCQGYYETINRFLLEVTMQHN